MARRRRRMSRGPRFDFRDPLLDAPNKRVVDLHGLTAETAKARLQNELSTIRRRDPTTVVHIVTGKGNNSAGEPVLRGLVRRLLERDLRAFVADWSLDEDAGGYIVRLR